MPVSLLVVLAHVGALCLAAFVGPGCLASAKPVVAKSRALAEKGSVNTFCNDVMCIRGDVVGDTVEYTLTSTGNQPTGWMAIGFGTRMANSPMIIAWPNRDGSFTLSQRKAPFEAEPKVDPNPPFHATLLQDQSLVHDAQVSVAFSVPLDRTIDEHREKQIIWAFGRSHAEPAVDATLKFHYRAGRTNLTLSHSPEESTSDTSTNKPTDNTNNAPAAEQTVEDVTTEPDALPLLSYQKTIVVHAVLSFVGFLVILPGGSLIARFLRIVYPSWVTIHWIIQFAAAGFTIACGLAAAYHSVDKAGAAHFDDAHKRWGIFLVVLYAAQCLGGVLIHRIHPEGPTAGRLHTAFGLSVVALAFFQTRMGFTTEWTAATGLAQLSGIEPAWWIMLIAVLVLYVLGLYLPRQKGIELALSDKSDREAVAMESMPLRASEDEDEMDTPTLESPSKVE